MFHTQTETMLFFLLHSSVANILLLWYRSFYFVVRWMICAYSMEPSLGNNLLLSQPQSMTKIAFPNDAAVHSIDQKVILLMDVKNFFEEWILKGLMGRLLFVSTVTSTTC